jgi:hypothetical protein
MFSRAIFVVVGCLIAGCGDVCDDAKEIVDSACEDQTLIFEPDTCNEAQSNWSECIVSNEGKDCLELFSACPANTDQ